jgi:hypothetical protein
VVRRGLLEALVMMPFGLVQQGVVVRRGLGGPLGVMAFGQGGGGGVMAVHLAVEVAAEEAQKA